MKPGWLETSYLMGCSLQEQGAIGQRADGGLGPLTVSPQLQAATQNLELISSLWKGSWAMRKALGVYSNCEKSEPQPRQAAPGGTREPCLPLFGASAQNNVEYLGCLGSQIQGRRDNDSNKIASASHKVPLFMGSITNPWTRKSKSLKYSTNLSAHLVAALYTPRTPVRPVFSDLHCSFIQAHPFLCSLLSYFYPSFKIHGSWLTLYRSSISPSFSRTGLSKLKTTPNLAPAKHRKPKALLRRNMLQENFF